MYLSNESGDQVINAWKGLGAEWNTQKWKLSILLDSRTPKSHSVAAHLPWRFPVDFAGDV